MPVYNIPDRTDPRVAVYRDLPRVRDRSRDGRFIVEGRFLLQRLRESGLAMESILTDEQHLEFALAHSHPQTPVFVADKQLLDETLGFRFHRGLLACGREAECPSLDSQLQQLSDQPAVFVLLDRVVDQENMGGVIRTAAALGAAGVVVGPKSAHPYSRRALRVSMGAVFQLRPTLSSNLATDIDKLQQAGFQIVASQLSDDAAPLEACPRNDRVALILGNEGDGIGIDFARKADHRVTIPMLGGIDSLNVTSAAAIFIHHFVRQTSGGQ